MGLHLSEHLVGVVERALPQALTLTIAHIARQAHEPESVGVAEKVKRVVLGHHVLGLLVRFHVTRQFHVQFGHDPLKNKKNMNYFNNPITALFSIVKMRATRDDQLYLI
jgi:hypothetical protein